MKPKSSTNEYTIPFDVVPLPSGGKLYTSGSLQGRDSVEIQYLTAIQEDILTSPNLIQTGKMFEVLLRSVLRDKTIDPNEFCLGDRNALIIWLRSTGYGSDYPVELVCGSCGAKHEYEFDLGSLESRELEVNSDQDGLFEFKTPVGKKTLKFKFLTAKDEMDILKKVEDYRKKMKSQVDNTLSAKMMKSVVSVDGSSDPFVIKRFVESMPIRDARAFREYVAKMEPGIIMEQEVECPECGSSSKEVIPIRANFFWPDSGV